MYSGLNLVLKKNQQNAMLGTLGKCHCMNLRQDMKLEASVNAMITSPELGEEQQEKSDILTKKSERRLGLVDMFAKFFANYADIQDFTHTDYFLGHFT